MALPEVTHTERTQDAVLRALNSLVRVRFPADFKDVFKAGVSQGCLSALAWMHAQRSFYYNRLSINAFLESCDEREACRALCKALGYTMRPASSASVAVRAYPDPPQTVPVTLRQGEQVLVGDLIFEVPTDYTIPAGKSVWPDDTTDNIISLVEGSTAEDEFVGDGSAFQEFEVSKDGVIDGSVVVTIAGEVWDIVESVIFTEGDGYGRDIYEGDGLDNQTYDLALLYAIIDPDSEDAPIILVDGTRWLLVSSFTGAAEEVTVTQTVDGLSTVAFGLAADGSAPVNGAQIDVIYQISGPQQRVELKYDDDDRATVVAGDGDSGLIPATGAAVVVSYRVGGGTQGNIDIGALDTTIRGYLPDGKQINVRLYNYEPGSGGEDRETLDHAKFYAPRVAKSNDRAVRKEDYDALGSTYIDALYGAPAYASAKLKQDKPERNEVEVAVWSRDANGRLATAQDALKEALRGYLLTKRVETVYITMVDGTVLYFDVELGVSLYTGYYSDTVFSSIQTALQTFFNSALVKPGDDLSISQLYEVLQQVEGVYRVVIYNLTGTLQMLLELTGDGTTQAFTDRLVKPDGLDIQGNSVQIKTPNQASPTQTVTDDGDGALIGDVDPLGTNTINYDTGEFTVTFGTAPDSGAAIYVEARYVSNLEWEETLDSSDGALSSIDVISEYFPITKTPPRGVAFGQTVQFTVPEELQPVVPGRLFLIGGYGTGELIAYDDGAGNIAGDVDGTYTNEIDYETGLVSFRWNAVPPDSGGIGTTITVSPVPDGVTTSFTWTAAAIGWAAILATGLYEGRLKIDFSTAWAASGFRDAFDNWQGRLDGLDLDHFEIPTIDYAAGTGTLKFLSAPQAGEPAVVPITLAPVTVMLYSNFVWYVKTLAAAGHDHFLYADNEGRLWGQPAASYPTNQLIHATGHLIADLASGPVVSGRTPIISYDAWRQSNKRDIPVDSLEIGGLGTVLSEELEKEIDL